LLSGATPVDGPEDPLLGSRTVRRLKILLLIALLGAPVIPVSAPPAAADHRPGPCSLDRGDDESVHHWVKRLIRCATNRWEVPGGARKAICIARHESGLDPKASSPSGDYLGLFQHSAVHWPDRYEAWTRRVWDLDRRARNGRTNTIVTMRIVNAHGWGPWKGVDGC
jgi:hypothetical protein